LRSSSSGSYEDAAAAAAAARASLQDDRRSVFSVVNSVLGSGALGYPYCFKECGLALATLLMLATLAAAELGMRLLLLSGQIAGRRTYGDVARHALGAAGHLAVELSVGVMSMGSIVAYLNILADTFSTVAGSIVPPGAEPSRNAILVGAPASREWGAVECG
jgi:sodium-coupled neutral amino acid transporter 10